MASRHTLDMTTGPVFRKLLLFAYPLMLNTLINTFYNIADKMIAGRFIGDNAMAAVGACSSPLTLQINIVVGIASGVAVLCGNYIGANRQKELRECMHCIPLAGFLCGLLLCIFGIPCSRPLLIAMDTPDSILADSNTYMIIRMLGIPLQISNTFCVNILTAHGDTKRITLSGFLSGFVNVLGNLVFVTIIPLGIAGIALATVLSQLLALAIKLIILFSPKDSYRLRFSEIRLYPQHLKLIFSIGLPTGLNSVAFSFSNVLLQSSVNSFGETIIAGNSCADTLSTLVTVFPIQMNAACSCAAAQCFGAKNYRRIDESVRKGAWGTVLMTTAACGIVTIFAMPLMRLFTDSTAVASAGVPKLMYSTWGYVIYIFSLVYGGALKGMRRSGTMMLLNFFGVCLPRILWVWFVFPFFSTPNVLYLIYPVSYLISALLLGIAYHRKLRKLINEQDQALPV